MLEHAILELAEAITYHANAINHCAELMTVRKAAVPNPAGAKAPATVAELNTLLSDAPSGLRFHESAFHATNDEETADAKCAAVDAEVKVTKKTPAAERAKVIEQVDTPVEEAPVEAVEMTKEEAVAFNKEVLQPAARAFTQKFPNMLKTLFPRFAHNGVVPVSVVKAPALHPSLYQAFADVLNKAIATGKLED